MAIQSFRPTVGGAELQLERLLPFLADRDVVVTIVTRAYRGCPRLEHVPGGTLRRTRVAGTSRRASAVFVGETLAYLVRRRRSIDVVHAHGMLSEGTIALGATLLGIPAVVTVLGTGHLGEFERLAKKPGGRARMRWLTRRVSFIALSIEVRDELAAYGVPASRIFEIPNGVDCALYRPATTAEQRRLRSELGLSDRPTAVFVGRLNPIKQIDTVIRALAGAPELDLVIAGDGPERRPLEQLAIKANVADHMKFVGLTHRVPDYLRASDAFVLPSRAEGMSNALLEAMACGLRCLATPVSGVPQLLGDDRGIVVSSGDVAAWTAALQRIVVHRSHHEHTRARVATYIRANFSIEIAADRIVAAYRALLTEREE